MPDAFRGSVLFFVVLALLGSMLVAVPQVAVAAALVEDREAAEQEGSATTEDRSAHDEGADGEESSDTGEELHGPSVGGGAPGARFASVSGWPEGAPWGGTPRGPAFVYLPNSEDLDTPWHGLRTRVTDSGFSYTVPVTNPLPIAKAPTSANSRLTNVFFARSGTMLTLGTPAHINDFLLYRIAALPQTASNAQVLSLPTNFTPRQACAAVGVDIETARACEVELWMVPSAANGSMNNADRNLTRYHRIYINRGSDPVLPPPTITVHPSDDTVYEGQTAGFLGWASNATSQQWQMSTNGGLTWQNVVGATGAALSVGPTNLAMSNRLYRVVFTNGNGSINSNAARLTVLPAAPPSISAQPSDVTVFEGQTASFSASASDATSQQWQVSSNGGLTWQNVAGGTGASLSVGPATLAMDSQLYRAVFTNASVSVQSNAARLTVLPRAAPVVLKHPEDVSVGAPRGATFAAAAESPTEMTVQWQRAVDAEAADREEWVDVDGATHDTYEIGATTLEMDGSLYRAVFANASGSVTTDAATLSVWVSPGARLSVTPRAVPVTSFGANT